MSITERQTLQIKRQDIVLEHSPPLEFCVLRFFLYQLTKYTYSKVHCRKTLLPELQLPPGLVLLETRKSRRATNHAR